jgi:hypothetical protein
LDSRDPNETTPDRRMIPERLAEYRKAFPEILPEENVATLRQSLLLTNGPDIHDLLTPERSGTIEHLLTLADAETITREAFLQVLGRLPDEQETQASVAFLEARVDQPTRGVDHLVWALLTSTEFRFNH